MATTTAPKTRPRSLPPASRVRKSACVLPALTALAAELHRRSAEGGRTALWVTGLRDGDVVSVAREELGSLWEVVGRPADVLASAVRAGAERAFVFVCTPATAPGWEIQRDLELRFRLERAGQVLGLVVHYYVLGGDQEGA